MSKRSNPRVIGAQRIRSATTVTAMTAIVATGGLVVFVGNQYGGAKTSSTSTSVTPTTATPATSPASSGSSSVTSPASVTPATTTPTTVAPTYVPQASTGGS